jgi:hypothetical protein
MSFLNRSQLALETVLQAEATLQAYSQSGVSNPEEQKRLEDAVHIAIAKLIDQPDLLAHDFSPSRSVSA